MKNKTFQEKLADIIIDAIVPPAGEKAGVTELRTKQAILDLIESDVIGQPLSWKDFRGVTFDSYDDAVSRASFRTIERQRSILRREAE